MPERPLSAFVAASRKLIQPAGMKRWQMNAEEPGPVPGYNGDRPLAGRSKRPCSSCGKLFQPTLARRLLCAYCFKGGHKNSGSGGMAA